MGTHWGKVRVSSNRKKPPGPAIWESRSRPSTQGTSWGSASRNAIVPKINVTMYAVSLVPNMNASTAAAK